MPNGFDGPKDDWNRMEAPLVKLDSVLDSFADIHLLSKSVNYHNWPERSLVWSSDGVHKLIQIYSEDEKDLTLTVWICASEDRGTQRYWRQQFIKKALSLYELEQNLPDVLSSAKQALDSWSSSDLEIATTLNGHRT